MSEELTQAVQPPMSQIGPVQFKDGNKVGEAVTNLLNSTTEDTIQLVFGRVINSNEWVVQGAVFISPPVQAEPTLEVVEGEKE